jgi:hypothetical protein
LPADVPIRPAAADVPVRSVIPSQNGDDGSPKDGSEEPKRRKLDVTGSQVLAGALAASTSAVAASYLGVAGTVIGAGLGSVVATVSTALYKHSLVRSTTVIQKVVPPTLLRDGSLAVATRRLVGEEPPATAPDKPTQVIRTHAQPDGETEVLGTVPVGEPPVEETPTNVLPSGIADDIASGTDVPAKSGLKSMRWGPVLLASAAVFLIVMGVITAIELAGGRTLNAAVHGKKGDGHTSVGVIHRTVPSSAPKDEESTSPSEEPSSEPGSGNQGSTPSDGPSDSSSDGPDTSPAPGASDDTSTQDPQFESAPVGPADISPQLLTGSPTQTLTASPLVP